MLDKFNFYDVLGYLIPGGLTFVLLYLAGTPLVTGSIPSLRAGDIPDLGSTLGGALLLVAISYAVGHLVQAVGESWEMHGNKVRGARISECMLWSTTDDTFTIEVRKLIRAKGLAVFGLPKYPADDRARLRELFEMCYRQMINRNCHAHTDLYLAISGLSRGLLVVSWLGLILGTTTLARELLILSSSGRSDVSVIGLGAGLMVFSLIGWGLAHYHYYRFRRYFAQSVWVNFLVN